MKELNKQSSHDIAVGLSDAWRVLNSSGGWLESAIQKARDFGAAATAELERRDAERAALLKELGRAKLEHARIRDECARLQVALGCAIEDTIASEHASNPPADFILAQAIARQVGYKLTEADERITESDPNDPVMQAWDALDAMKV